jgi:hypothetical protein
VSLHTGFGERVIVQFVTEEDETDIALGRHGDYGIASGEVVLDDRPKLVRCHALEASDRRHRSARSPANLLERRKPPGNVEQALGRLLAGPFAA